MLLAIRALSFDFGCNQNFQSAASLKMDFCRKALFHSANSTRNYVERRSFDKYAKHADLPIFVLLTHPRATATAFEQVMRTHKKIQVLHAPYLDPYLLRKYGPNHQLTRSLSQSEVTFEDITEKLFAMAKTTPVFFKESGYILLEYLKTHPEFYKNPQMKIAFLVRDPAKSILSFYKKMPTVDESIVGHRQLWELFVLLKNELPNVPPIIDSDALLKDPLSVLQQLGQSWNLAFDKSNLQWESGYADDWHVRDWYAEVANSTELGPYPGDVARNEERVPLYLEITDEKDRLRMQTLYKTQNEYYQKFLRNHIAPDQKE